MRALARRSPLKAYLFLAYLWGGVVFAIPLLSQAGIGVIPVDLPGAAPFVMLAAFGLAAVGGLVSRWSGGTANSAEYRRRVSRFRVYPLWYPAAALLLPIIAISTALMAGFDPIAALADDPHLVPSVLGGLLAAFLLVNWWEEAGGPDSSSIGSSQKSGQYAPASLPHGSRLPSTCRWSSLPEE